MIGNGSRSELEERTQDLRSMSGPTRTFFLVGGGCDDVESPGVGSHGYAVCVALLDRIEEGIREMNDGEHLSKEEALNIIANML